MKKRFIAEIGNNHFGRLDYFKELIHAASESGADMVKGQLFDPEKIKGSMPKEFYKECFKVAYYLDEIKAYAKSLNMPIFFSCFDSFLEFERYQSLKKISASQSLDIFKNGNNIKEWNIDRGNVLISLHKDLEAFPILKQAVVMHVSDYLTDDPNLSRIEDMNNFYNSIHDRKPGLIGYSDHTIGIDACCDAINQYKVNYIEKHFTLSRNMKWKGEIFRDTVHGADPNEFKELTRRFK